MAQTRQEDFGTVSVIIPTFNEAGNIQELLTRIADAVPDGMDADVLFVDDSTDETPEVIEKVAADLPLPVAVHRRAEPAGGLGGAVVEGIARTAARWIVVMDADLQHPPEVMPELIARGEREGAELVVASRYADGGSRKGLSGGYRVLVSGASTALTKTLFPRALRGISDPMSGFFAIRREVVARSASEGDEAADAAKSADAAATTLDTSPALQPLGYKILLELAVRCAPRTVAEVPFTFQERFAGESKSTVREGMRFLRHLVRLRASSALSRSVAFAAIGLTGLLPNLTTLWLLTHAADMHYATAEIIANQFGLLWNFVLADTLVYSERRRFGSLTRLLGFATLANADLVVRIPLMVALVDGAGLTPVPATAISLTAVFVLRFVCVDRLLYVYQPRGRGSRRGRDNARRPAATELSPTSGTTQHARSQK